MKTLIRLLLKKQPDLGLHGLSRPFCQTTSLQNFRTFIVIDTEYVHCNVTHQKADLDYDTVISWPQTFRNFHRNEKRIFFFRFSFMTHNAKFMAFCFYSFPNTVLYMLYVEQDKESISIEEMLKVSVSNERTKYFLISGNSASEACKTSKR